jgi:hypothetical protein
VHPYMQTNKKRSHFFMPDLVRSCDRIDLDLIHSSLVFFGFTNKWIDHIMTCVSTSSFAVLINGEPSAIFWRNRGIPKEDPLSPLSLSHCYGEAY